MEWGDQRQLSTTTLSLVNRFPIHFLLLFESFRLIKLLTTIYFL